MNITHAVTENIVGDKLEAIFNRQKELMDKYTGQSDEKEINP